MYKIKKRICLFLLLLAGCEAKSVQHVSSIEPQLEKQTYQEDQMETMYMHINEESFTIKLYQQEAVDFLLSQLPMEIDMSDLHDNEKYVYVTQTYPIQPQIVNTIQSGDIMLYGDQCLVLFYKDFPTSIAYTRLGYVEEKDELMSILPAGSVHIRLTKERR